MKKTKNDKIIYMPHKFVPPTDSCQICGSDITLHFEGCNKCEEVFTQDLIHKCKIIK